MSGGQLVRQVMGEPHGEVMRVEHSTIASAKNDQVPATKGPQAEMTDTVLEVTFRVAGETQTNRLPDGEWNVRNAALLFLAFIGRKPSDLADGPLDLRGEHITVPVTYQEGQYFVRQDALSGATEDLIAADWIDTSHIE